MTREEAVTVLKAFMENPLFSEVHKAAFNIAIHDIKAYQDWNINNLILVNKDNYEPIEQEPTTKNDLRVDAVSRKSVITIIQSHWWNCRDIDKLVNELPSATPQEPRWISVSERLPEEHIIADGYIEPSDYVLVQMKSGLMHVTRYWGNRQCMAYEDWLDLHYPTTDEVIAWMPLPKPYEPQESEVDNETGTI